MNLGIEELFSLSCQMADMGDRREAAVLARTAVKGAERSSTPLTRALLLERVAWARARAGDLAITEQALGEVDRVFEQHREGKSTRCMSGALGNHPEP